jgi:hypothetical protein
MRKSPSSLRKVGWLARMECLADMSIGDQHLLAEAPAYAPHRLRKAELIRLWKVAGMWTTGDEDEVDSIASTADEDDDGGLGKKELVDGLVAAVGRSGIRDQTPS